MKLSKYAAVICAILVGASQAKAGGHGNALTPFTTGFDGWTIIGSTAGTGQANCGSFGTNPGTCWYYVSQSTGSDSNTPCTNINAPCQTIAVATGIMQTRTGKPDHLNILCGDTIPFVSGRALTIQNYGVSATAPAVFTTYCPGLPEGSGTRATLLANCSDGIGVFGTTGNFAAIINLRTYSYVRDPVGNPGQYNAACTNTGTGLSKGNGRINWLLVEGSTFEYFANGVSFTGGNAPQDIQNLLVRRNIIYASWGTGNTTGMFGGGQIGAFVLEENVIGHNGWNSGVPIFGGAQDHNLYLDTGGGGVSPQPPFPNATTFPPPVATQVIEHGNIIFDGTGNDQGRNGGEWLWNLWVGNPGALSTGGQIVTVANNVITEAADFQGGGPGGNGVTINTVNAQGDFTAIPPQPQSFTGNIFSGNTGTAQTAPFFMQGANCNHSLQTCSIPATSNNVTGNVACSWGGGTGSIVNAGTEGAILSYNVASLIGGINGQAGVYPGTKMTGGSGTSAVATVIVGPGGNVTSVNGIQFGGVGALFTGTATGTSNLAVTNMQTGGFILPNQTGVTTTLLDSSGNSLGRSIFSQTNGNPNGNGNYLLSGSLTYSGNAEASTLPDPAGGKGYVGGDTLSAATGTSAGQIPNLTGFSIKVAAVASNNYTTPIANTYQAANCNGLGPNSTISVGSYSGSIGGTATTAAFIAAALAKSKSDNSGNSLWPYNLSAYAVVGAYQSAFGQTPNAPVYSP